VAGYIVSRHLKLRLEFVARAITWTSLQFKRRFSTPW